MKALSIKQVWAWAILNAGKDIENRDWSTSFRGTIAVHASKGLTKNEYLESSFAVSEINKDVSDSIPLYSSIVRGAIIGTVEIVDCVSKSESDWFFGDYGFVLRNPIALPESICIGGALGFWNVPPEIEKEINYQASINVG